MGEARLQGDIDAYQVHFSKEPRLAMVFVEELVRDRVLMYTFQYEIRASRK